MNEKIELGCLGIVLAKVGTVGNGQCDLPVAKVKSLARLGMKCLRKTSLLHPWRRSQFLKSLWHPWKWRQCLKWRVLLQSPLGLRKQVRFASTSMQHGVLPQAAGTLATNIGREVAHFAASNQANRSHLQRVQTPSQRMFQRKSRKRTLMLDKHANFYVL